MECPFDLSSPSESVGDVEKHSLKAYSYKTVQGFWKDTWHGCCVVFFMDFSSLAKHMQHLLDTMYAWQKLHESGLYIECHRMCKECNKYVKSHCYRNWSMMKPSILLSHPFTNLSFPHVYYPCFSSCLLACDSWLRDEQIMAFLLACLDTSVNIALYARYIDQYIVAEHRLLQNHNLHHQHH